MQTTTACYLSGTNKSMSTRKASSKRTTWSCTPPLLRNSQESHSGGTNPCPQSRWILSPRTKRKTRPPATPNVAGVEAQPFVHNVHVISRDVDNNGIIAVADIPPHDNPAPLVVDSSDDNEEGNEDTVMIDGVDDNSKDNDSNNYDGNSNDDQDNAPQPDIETDHAEPGEDK